ncbi:hypothetical protein LCGC14_2836110, partial [marine sediment metagenome]
MIAVKAVPGASRDRVVGVLGDCLKVATSQPAEKGKANKAIAAQYDDLRAEERAKRQRGQIDDEQLQRNLAYWDKTEL